MSMSNSENLSCIANFLCMHLSPIVHSLSHTVFLIETNCPTYSQGCFISMSGGNCERSDSKVPQPVTLTSDIARLLLGALEGLLLLLSNKNLCYAADWLTTGSSDSHWI